MPKPKDILVGFYSYGGLVEVGLKADLQVFFQLVDELVIREHPSNDWSLIKDRFYKRYLRWEELEPAKELMDKIKTIFSCAPIHYLNGRTVCIASNTQFDFTCETLAAIFTRFFTGFFDSIETARGCDYSQYISQPLRIVRTSPPDLQVDKIRSLVLYDKLQELPLWFLPLGE